MIRCATYGRVSDREQIEGYSLAAQSRASRQHAADNDWQIVAEYADEGITARKDDVRKRPQFHQMLLDADAHQFDVLLVHKLDRFSRNLHLTLECLERLGRANVALVSIVERLDYSTPQGRLFLHILATLAQHFSENLSQEIRKGKSERKAQGKHNGILPYGVMLQGEGKDSTPVPDTRALPNGSTAQTGVVRALDLAGQGASLSQIAGSLNQAGYRTAGNRGANLWTVGAVRHLLLNRFYIGHLPDGHGGWQPGNHGEIVDRALFWHAQEQRATVAHPHTRRDKQTHMLTGLLWCTHCLDAGRTGRMKLATQQRPNGPYTVAACIARERGLGCPQTHSPAHCYEEQVSRWIAGWRLTDAGLARAMQVLEERDAPDREGERRKLKAELDRLIKLYQWGDLPERQYLAERSRITLSLQVLDVPERTVDGMDADAVMLREMQVAWALATDEQQNLTLRQILRRVVVRDGVVERLEMQDRYRALLLPWSAPDV